MKETEIGEVPDDWDTIELKDIFEFYVPQRNKPKVFRGSIPWVRIEDFEGKYVYGTKSNQYVDEEIVKEMNLRILPSGSLVCSCSADVGICAVTKTELITNQTFIGMVPNASIDTEFYYYYMTSQKERLSRISSGSTIVYIPRKRFEHFRVVQPSLQEQQRIASALSCIDSAIQQTDKVIERASNLKKGLMQELLTKGIGHKKFKETELGTIPEDWNILNYSVATVKDSADFEAIKTKGYQENGKYPIIDQGQEMITGYTDNESAIYKGQLPVIVFGDHTLVVKYIDFEFAIGADGTKIVKANKERFVPKFLYYTICELNLKSEGYKRHFSKLREQLFVCPPVKEQEKITSILSAIDTKIDSELEKRAQFESLKKGLMQDLLTGKVRFPEFIKDNGA